VKSPGLRWPDTAPEVLIREAKASRERVLPFSTGRLPPPAPRTGARRVHKFAWGALAAILVCIGLALLIRETPQEFATALGEQRSILLGRWIARDAKYRFGDPSQSARSSSTCPTRERGGAIRSGTRLTRPFEVLAGNAVIRDVGTQFNVDMHSTSTTVTVVEGQVAINSAQA
jgi:ferric-dicitrate binding protein FerR (iron transport regulator)